MDDVKIVLQCIVALWRKVTHFTTWSKINRPLSLQDYNPLIRAGALIQENVFHVYMTMKKVFLEQIAINHCMLKC